MHVFWGMKKLVQLKFVQLLLLNRVKAKWSKNRAAQGFYYINSFSSSIFGPYSKTCTCKVRAAWGRVSRGLTVAEFCVNKGVTIYYYDQCAWNQQIHWAEPKSSFGWILTRKILSRTTYIVLSSRVRRPIGHIIGLSPFHPSVSSEAFLET